MSIPGSQRMIYLAGLALAAAFIPLLFLPALNGPYLPLFLLCFSLAAAAYLLGMSQLRRTPIPQGVLWGAAVLARLVLLGTVLSLSDDVYRYLWDGHLLLQGINPYAQTVSAPILDAYATPLRQLVNHPGMATPYLPAAQGYFWLLEGIAPQQALTHRAAAMLLDLLTGLVIRYLLLRLRLNPAAVIVYLWNPLLMVEFAGSGHVDALMLFLGMAGWAFVFAENKWRRVSAPLLALAALIKGPPMFFGFLWLRRWGFAGVALYLTLIAAALAGFAAGAGWGLGPALDGRGLMGAIRIYARYWQFNPGLLFSLAGSLPGLSAETAALVSRTVAGLLMGIVLAATAIKAWRLDQRGTGTPGVPRALLRLSLLPAGAYLLLSPTVHPWYVTFMLPLLPFFIPDADDPPHLWRWAVPWVYFSLAVVLSYLAYPPWGDGSVPGWVLWVEYLPLYAGLAWAYFSNRPAAAE